VGAIVLGFLFNVSFLVLLVAIVGGITGLTVVFQRPLNDLVSGVSLTVSNRLAPGDWIRLPSGVEGNVTDIQWDVTIIKQLANNVIVVPNSTLTEAEIINFDRFEPELSVAVAVGVSYDSNLALVEQVTLEEANNIMRQVNGSDSTAAPVVRYNAFADSSINFNVFLRAAKYADQFVLKHEFIKRLHQRYGEEGIVIPFPIRTLDIPPARQGALMDQARHEAKEAG
jgi:small-conductance mechanosensitive channel